MVSLINKLLFKPLVHSRSEFYCIKSPWLYAAIYKGHLVGLENVRIEKLHYNVRYQYIPPACDVGLGLDIVVAVSKKPLKWSLRREGSDGTIICFLHTEGLTVQEF